MARRSSHRARTCAHTGRDAFGCKNEVIDTDLDPGERCDPETGEVLYSAGWLDNDDERVHLPLIPPAKDEQSDGKAAQ